MNNPTPEQLAANEAMLNDWAKRANEVAERMQQQGLPMTVTVGRAARLGGSGGITLELNVGPMAQIALYEMLCDHIEEKILKSQME